MKHDWTRYAERQVYSYLRRQLLKTARLAENLYLFFLEIFLGGSVLHHSMNRHDKRVALSRGSRMCSAVKLILGCSLASLGAIAQPAAALPYAPQSSSNTLLIAMQSETGANVTEENYTLSSDSHNKLNDKKASINKRETNEFADYNQLSSDLPDTEVRDGASEESPLKTYFLNLISDHPRQQITLNPPATKLKVSVGGGANSVRCNDGAQTFTCASGKPLIIERSADNPVTQFWAQNSGGGSARIRISVYR